MQIVTDSNILFSYFWEDLLTKKLLCLNGLYLISPELSLKEINKYQKEICRKACISKKEFDIIKKEIAVIVEFVPIEEYQDFLAKAWKISPDPNDLDFFAIALKHDLPIWSDDKLLKEQHNVPIYSTKDLLSNNKFRELLF